MLSREKVEILVEEERKRLKVNCPEFIRRHNEIMAIADEIQGRYKKNTPTGSLNTDRSE